jgi:uncharacterized protein (DUF302 family)
MPDLTDNGMVHLESPRSVSETLARLETVVRAKGLTILAQIDHSGDAAKAGVAIDLPLKALVWQDADDKVWLSYNSPDYLKQRHHLPDNLMQNIAGIKPICEEAVR